MGLFKHSATWGCRTEVSFTGITMVDQAHMLGYSKNIIYTNINIFLYMPLWYVNALNMRYFYSICVGNDYLHSNVVVIIHFPIPLVCDS